MSTLFEQGEDDESIAAALDRTAGAVSHRRLRRLGLVRSRLHPVYSPQVSTSHLTTARGSLVSWLLYTIG